MPANDDPNSAAAAAPPGNYKLVQAIVIILGVLIVLAFGALVWGFITKLGGHDTAAHPQAPDYVFPAGSKIMQIQTTNTGRIVMAVQTSAGAEVDVFDADSGRLVVRIRPQK